MPSTISSAARARRHIRNRPLDDCYADFESGMEIIGMSEDAATKSVTASAPLLASRTARFDPLLGCQPDQSDGEVFALTELKR